MAEYDDFVRDESLSLLRTAYLLTGSKADAEDLVQEALLRVHKSWARVVRAHSRAAYVRRILINLFLSDRRRPRLPTMPLLADDHVLSDGGFPDLLADQDRVRASLALLPPRQRSAVVLRYYMGLTDAEIAEAMKISTSSARSAIARGLSALRTRLVREEIGQ